ncbi:hypothetical protein ACPESL_00935 [Psychrobacter pocilloporae]|uniref:hypothetical protein n=1 Tax=Psychrobacter pocilloporae TaxID=1775882 RepID=UPI003C2B77E9
MPTQTDMDNTAITLDNKEEHSDIESESSTQTIDPNAIILAEALTDKAIGWQIHNCKIIKKTVTQDLPLPFLYHYDSLDDAVKQSHPLTPELLLQFNTPMSAREAAQLIGIDEELLTSPWHVKIMGSLVVFSEALQLAVRLHWTNTGKKTQQIYTKDAADAIIAAFEDWQFFGRVDVLYKNNKQILISIDEQNPNTQELPAESLLTIEASGDYQQLLATHALATITKLEVDKAELPWFEKAILARLE